MAKHSKYSAPARLDNSSRNEIGKSTALISLCTLVSRLTGLGRTWAMAFALGQSVLSGSYAIANNLPNLLYELVAGGMLVTAFLPVYLSVRQKLGKNHANNFASNVFTILLILLGLASVLCILFANFVVSSQNMLNNSADMTYATTLFRFFAIQILFYGISSLTSAILNANKKYIWAAIAPAANNIVLISTFLLYTAIIPINPNAAFMVLAIGNPLGVFIQMVIQWPALKKSGLRLRLHINLKDPALKEVVSLGLPTLLVFAVTFIVVSVQSSAANVFLPSEGPSVIAYARLWYTLPFAFLAVPITTTMFTELSIIYNNGNESGFSKLCVKAGNQIIFLLIPFSLYLIVFAPQLITLFVAGEFKAEDVNTIALYLSTLALTLPLYGISVYLEKVFSVIRKMKLFAVVNVIGAILQVALTLSVSAIYSNNILDIGIESIALVSLSFYLFVDVVLYIYLKLKLVDFSLKSCVLTCVYSSILGFAGALAGYLLIRLCVDILAVPTGNIFAALAMLAVCGTISIIVTYGLALVLKVPESNAIKAILNRITSR